MVTQIYVWDKLRKNKQKELQYIRDFYFERISPIFKNAEHESSKYEQHLWENAIEDSRNYNDLDTVSIAEFCHEASIERYEILSLMNYRNICMWTLCLCQLWEQQLIIFVTKEMEMEGYTFNEVTFLDVKKCFSIHNYNLDEMKCWSKIKELRLVVNVIKHGDGASASSLRKLRTDYFEWPAEINFEKDKLQFYKSSLLDASLNISNNDFEEYYNALIAFWNEIPERMYSNK